MFILYVLSCLHYGMVSVCGLHAYGNKEAIGLTSLYLWFSSNEAFAAMFKCSYIYSYV